MRTSSMRITLGCGVVLLGLTGVLAVVTALPVTGVNSFDRFVFVGSAAVIPYAFGILVGVSTVYHAKRRGRFLLAFGAASIVALAIVYLASGNASIFSPAATEIADHVPATVIAVWVFLPLVGLFFGSLAVCVGRRAEPLSPPIESS